MPKLNIKTNGAFEQVPLSALYNDLDLHSNLIKITHSDLLKLKNNAELKAGTFYQITDYNCIINKVDVQSAGHQFDIIVLAISEDTLSEKAYATKHDGDTYFTKTVSEYAVEWSYTIYVDSYEDYGETPHEEDAHRSDRFIGYDYLTHPISGETVPVLYKTDISDDDVIDEPDESDPFYYEGTYELDGDTYDMWSKWEYENGDLNFVDQYALTNVIVEDGEFTIVPGSVEKEYPCNLKAWELMYSIDNATDRFAWATSSGKGVIYYMKDEYGNEAPYDFKNIMFKRYIISSVANDSLEGFNDKYCGLGEFYNVRIGSDYVYKYTFSNIDQSDNIIDGSLYGLNYSTINNVIKPYVFENVQTLNNIVFDGGCSYNVLELNCCDSTFVTSNSLKIGNDNRKILMLTSSYSDIKENCYGITICNSFRNSIGKSCYSISLGVACDNNEIKRASNNIIMFGSCIRNVIGIMCRNITLNASCVGNIFGNNCVHITLGTNGQFNIFDNNCTYIQATSYMLYCSFENAVAFLIINSSISGSISRPLRYYKFHNGVRGINSNNYITIMATRGLTYSTDVYMTGHEELEV